jgi:hypothetical protein
MAWKPKLATVAEQVKSGPRPWVAIAEEHAPEAIKLFVQVMKNQRYPIKVRMEAATRLVMVAGATFRGEKLDSQGRPAANLPGQRVTRLESGALREVLKQLPPGAVSVHPDLVSPGENVVVLHDGNHSRQKGEDCTQAVVGMLLEQSEEAPPVNVEEKVQAAKEYLSKPSPGDVKAEKASIPPAKGPALDLLNSIWKK